VGTGWVRGPGARGRRKAWSAAKAQAASGEGELGAEDGGHSQSLCRLGKAHYAVEPVVVGQRQGDKLEVGGFCYELLRIRGAVEEAEIRMTMELRVHDH